ncbi:MAG: TetR/AcrR family transcriptional regulator [Labilithrix sp.]|nr:TetR/AcrR family transcriptional regulator [Labilithrix sp.]
MKRTSSDEWVAVGVELLRSHGHQAITIDSLCAALSKTKGSFYHHFESVDAYLLALLATWEKELTTMLIASSSKEQGPARARARLDDEAQAIDHLLDRAVRAWGLHDERVRDAVTRVDARRVGYLEELHRQAGHSSPRQAAMLEYAMFLGVQHLEVLPRTKDKRALAAAFQRRLRQDISAKPERQH